jgi:hypothetical protein
MAASATFALKAGVWFRRGLVGVTDKQSFVGVTDKLLNPSLV